LKNNLEIFKVPLPLGGLNDTDDEMSVPPNVAVDMLNMEFDGNGLKVRDGYTAYSTSGLPSSAVEGFYVFKDSGANEYLLVYSDTAWYAQTTTGVFSSIKSSLTSGTPWNFTTLADWAIGANGVNEPVKYDGSTAYTLKVDAPTSAPSTATGSAGNLTGDYQYQVTFVTTSGAETNPSSSSTIVSPSSEQVDMTAIPTGTGDVASRKIYRTEAGESTFYYLATISDNTTTTYTDDTIDVNLGSAIAPSTHTDPPSNGKFPAVYKEFLFLVDPDFPTRAYFSHQSYPEIFDTTEGTGNYLQVGLNDGQEIIGIKALRGTLFGFKERSTWPIVGSDANDFKVATQPLTSSIGLYHKSMAYVDIGKGDMIVGLSKHGLYLFDGYTYENIGVQRQSGIDITTFIDGLDKNQLNWASGYNDVKKSKYRLTVREAGYAYNNKEIIWDYKRNRIAITDIAHNGMVSWNNVVLFGSSESSGGVYQIGGINDDGSAISWRVEWPWWYLGDDITVDLDRVNIDTVLHGDYSPTVTIYTDGNSVGHDMSLSDGADWTTSSVVTEGNNYRSKVPLDGVGSDEVRLSGVTAMKLKIEHSTLNEPVNINAITVYYSTTREQSGISVDPTVVGAGGL